MPQASAEAQAAFGDGGLYIEKVIAKARHIEVQVLGDGERAIHCFERECSLQRRRQKVWEEAPSPVLPDDGAREALRLRRGAGRSGAAIAAPARSNISMTTRPHDFYFIEMNTRIQVEHPVTEFITGIDLVREMIRIAGGERCAIAQEDITLQGPCDRSAHQCRGPGEELHAVPRHGRGAARSGRPRHALRYHALSGLSGAALLRFAARQAHRLGRDARAARSTRMERALGELEIGGLKTTKPLHLLLAADDRGAGRRNSIRAGSSLARSQRSAD